MTATTATEQTAPDTAVLASRVPDTRTIPLNRTPEPQRAAILRRVLGNARVEVPAAAFQSSI